MRIPCRWLAFPVLLVIASDALAQEAGNLVTAQKKELAALSIMDGVWRGAAWIMLPDGTRQEMTQTERVGPLLDGAVKVVEGRGYDDAGKTVFNALGVIAFDARQKKLVMHSYAQGRSGDFPLQLTEDGFTWEIAAGPATIRYIAKIANGEWNEYGERIVGDQQPMRFFEMKLKRIADCDWPAANPVEAE